MMMMVMIIKELACLPLYEILSCFSYTVMRCMVRHTRCTHLRCSNRIEEEQSHCSVIPCIRRFSSSPHKNMSSTVRKWDNSAQREGGRALKAGGPVWGLSFTLMDLRQVISSLRQPSQGWSGHGNTRLWDHQKNLKRKEKKTCILAKT